jgi:hypothetical protein
VSDGYLLSTVSAFREWHPASPAHNSPRLNTGGVFFLLHAVDGFAAAGRMDTDAYEQAHRRHRSLTDRHCKPAAPSEKGSFWHFRGSSR